MDEVIKANYIKNIVKCSQFSPNIHKLTLCENCQASKSIHSESAVKATVQTLIGIHTFKVSSECRDENCILPIIDKTENITLYDSGMLKIGGDDTLMIDLSQYRILISFVDDYRIDLQINEHRYSLMCDKSYPLNWKCFLRKLADQQNSAKKRQTKADARTANDQMSKLVILEGFLKQKIKNKDGTEIYAVLTSTCLRIFRSQIAYKQNPENATRTLDFSDNYNIIPMPFEKSHIFSLFKRGEKSEERLYLEAATATDYDLWISNVEGIILKKNAPSRVSSPKKPVGEVVTTPNASTMPVSTTTPTSVVSPVTRSTPPRFNIITPVDDKVLQLTCEKLEADLKNEKRFLGDAVTMNEELQKRLKEAEQKITELDKERRDLKWSLEKANKEKDLSNGQLVNASDRICKAINSSKTNNSSYEFLVSYLCANDTQSSILKTFLRHQLEYLIHRSPIETAPELSFFEYLTGSLKMSQESLSKFVSTFLLSLSKQMNPSVTPNSDLVTHLNSVISSVVQMNPSPQCLHSNKLFQQTALEISYIIAPRAQDQSHLSNGYSEPSVVTEEFNKLIKSANLDSVTKTFFVELGKHVKEQIPLKTSNIANSEPLKNNVEKENRVTEFFNGLWNDLDVKLKAKDQEITDLKICLESFCSRILELEAELARPQDNRCIDSYVNYFISMTDNMCSSCQDNVCNKLKLPLTIMTDTIVDEFTSCWKCLNDLTSFLAKKRSSSSEVKDAVDLTKKCFVRFESLVKQFEEISQRSIRRPSLSSTSTSMANGKLKTGKGTVTSQRLLAAPHRRPPGHNK